jgi:hypothetical protein
MMSTAATSPHAAVERIRCCNRAATGPDTLGQRRKTTAYETAKTAYIIEIPRQGTTCPENPDLTYKEGVAGSNPASPT